jgi:hypothetical protein
VRIGRAPPGGAGVQPCTAGAPLENFGRSGWPAEGLWGYQGGVKWAKTCPCVGSWLGATRSRQDESNEVHEAGRIRRSLRGKEGHVVSLYPLIWRSLGRAGPPAH